MKDKLVFKYLWYRFLMLLSMLIPIRKLRRQYRGRYRAVIEEMMASPPVRHKIYGDIYMPYYTRTDIIRGDEPELYNRDGERIRTLFLRDAQPPFYSQISSRYLLMDRYNFMLKNHIYTNGDMKKTMGQPSKKYGIVIEAKIFTTYVFSMLEKDQSLREELDLIFTFDEEALDKYPNARLFNAFANVYMDFKEDCPDKEFLRDDAFTLKTKNISMISSRKIACPLHEYRLDLANKYKDGKKVDIFGTFNGGSFVHAYNTLKEYRYSVAIENDIQPYWFTEKILNCFATQTVPVYLGATKIGKFFNPDGIIAIRESTEEAFAEAIAICSEKDYESRLSAIKENYETVKKRYMSPWDRLYEDYLKEDLGDWRA